MNKLFGRLLLVFLMASCAPTVIEPTPTKTQAAPTATVLAVTPIIKELIPVKTPTATTALVTETALSYVPSGQAAALARQEGIVRIERASCSYHPDIDGQPTFCNDQPYPNHEFTLLVWGEDWRFLDGKCLLVQGDIDLYEGKPEIIADSLDQVFECP